MSSIIESIIQNQFSLIILYACVVLCLIYLLLCLLLKKRNRRYSKVKVASQIQLQRSEHNPILKPALYREWETVGTFNPATVKDDEGFIHLLYRAIGNDGLSRIGHAKSRDGLKFDDRTSYPVYVSTSTRTEKEKSNQPHAYNPSIYTSGGGWGGCEDPRAVVIEDCVYITYTAFEGWDSVRIGLTSIKMEDLKKSHWDWKRPRIISPANEVNKNWVLFPEKIDGKFAILHNVSPKIEIDYLDSVYDEDSGHIKSSAPSGGRPEHWDNRVRGAGAPPIRTELGWLLLYHAMDKKDPNKYKLGCMILDINEPTKILYRGHAPILEPDMPYENDWKPGVVYASGALIIGNDLVVYYGGGDKYVCVAKTPIKPLLDWLVTYGKI